MSGLVSIFFGVLGEPSLVEKSWGLGFDHVSGKTSLN